MPGFMNKKFLLILLIICSSSNIFPQSPEIEYQPYSKQSIILLAKNIVLDINSSPLDFQYGIAGWSKNGKVLIWSVIPQHSPYGYYGIFLNIFDLTINESVYSNVPFTLSESMTLEVNEKILNEFLDKLNITPIYEAPSKITSFPYSFNEDVIDLTIKETLISSEITAPNCPGHEDGICTCPKVEILTSNFKGILKYEKSSKLKEFSIKLEGYESFQTEGLFKSPFEDRIAIAFKLRYYSYFSLSDMLFEDILIKGVHLTEDFK